VHDSSSVNKDIEHFERWSATYERSLLQRTLFDRVHAAVLDAIAAMGAAPTSILDIGCGTGRLLRAMQARWPEARLFGVDPTEGMVRVARQLTPQATFFGGAAETLPLPDASVELAVSTVSFHHWADQAAGLRAIARVLRPGGRFLLADVSSPRWIARLFGNVRARDRATLRALFAGAGLRVVSQRPILGRFVVLTIGERDATETAPQRVASEPAGDTASVDMRQ
jgi:ubiquinone/menaquinone biosynthesis C-methylase UbiE